jgi:hypothetical protein
MASSANTEPSSASAIQVPERLPNTSVASAVMNEERVERYRPGRMLKGSRSRPRAGCPR